MEGGVRLAAVTPADGVSRSAISSKVAVMDTNLCSWKPGRDESGLDWQASPTHRVC